MFNFHWTKIIVESQTTRKSTDPVRYPKVFSIYNTPNHPTKKKKKKRNI